MKRLRYIIEDAEMAFDDWWHQPAKWWQFWLPQSGWIGGTLGGLIGIAVLLLLF